MNYYGIPWLVCILASLLAVALGFGDNILDRVLEVKLTLNNRYLIGIGLKDLMFCALLEKDKIINCDQNQVSLSIPNPSINNFKKYCFIWKNRCRAEVIYGQKDAQIECHSDSCKLQTFTMANTKYSSFLRLNPEVVEEAYWDIEYKKIIFKPVNHNLQIEMQRHPKINFPEFQRELANRAGINFDCFNQICIFWKLHVNCGANDRRTIAVLNFENINEHVINKKARFVPKIFFSQLAIPLTQIAINNCGLHRELTSKSMIPIIASAMPNDPTKLYEQSQKMLHNFFIYGFHATNINIYVIRTPSEFLHRSLGESSLDLSLHVSEHRIDHLSQEISYELHEPQIVFQHDSQAREVSSNSDLHSTESDPNFSNHSIVSEPNSENAIKWCPCGLQGSICQNKDESMLRHLLTSPIVNQRSTNPQQTDANLFTHQNFPLPSANSFKHQQDILSNDFSNSASTTGSPEQASQHEYYKYYTELQDFNNLLDNNLA